MKKLFKGLIKDIFEVLITAFIITFILTNYIGTPVQVEGKSMLPHLEENDFGFGGLINKSDVERFDIVVIDTGEKLIVKRVIGMPNEDIEYKDGNLYINNSLVIENFKHGQTNDFKVKTNVNEYYCLGDNREISKDSRYYGPFAIEQIKARHILVLFPFKNIGFNR